MSFADVVSRKLSTIDQVQSTVGVFVAMVDGLARVNVQGATVDIRCDGWNPPVPAMPVRIDTVNGIMRVVGPALTLPARATVLESIDGDTRALVDVGGVEYKLPVMAPYVPLPDDVVVLNWQSGHVLGEEAAAPSTADPGTIPSPSEPFTNLLIQPTASGKYDTNWDNWWSPPEVWASNVNKGIWVYDGRFAALAGAQIMKAEFCFPRPIKTAGVAYIGLHAYPSIPGGEPTISELTYLPPDRRSDWYELPAGWGDALRDNPHWGIGVTSGAGDNRWPGVGQAGGSQSGWLRFTGTR